MARARNIKPGFFENEDLAELGAEAMLLFAGLWTHVDREGRCEDRPKRIKAKVFPYFAVDVDTLLFSLQDRGFIRRYVVDETHYIQVVNFAKHQSPHVKEAASTIPAPGLSGANTELAPPDSLIADTGFSDCGLTDSGFPEPDAPPVLETPKVSGHFALFWNEWSTGITKGHGGKKPASEAWKRAGLDRAGAEVVRGELGEGLARWKASAYWQQEGGRFVMRAERWLKERAWDDEPPVIAARGSPGVNGRYNNDPEPMFELAKQYREQGQ
jgi:hypothetical protein